MLLNLKKIRINAKKTQREIAQYLNISEYTYSHYETEYALIPIKHLIRYCHYFQVSIDYVFGLTNFETYQNNYADVDLKKVSQNLKDFRKEFKLTQEKLAKILNIGKGTIADYERGRYLISTPFLYQMSKTYHISADYLLGRISEPKYLD